MYQIFCEFYVNVTSIIILFVSKGKQGEPGLDVSHNQRRLKTSASMNWALQCASVFLYGRVFLALKETGVSVAREERRYGVRLPKETFFVNYEMTTALSGILNSVCVWHSNKHATIWFTGGSWSRWKAGSQRKEGRTGTSRSGPALSCGACFSHVYICWCLTHLYCCKSGE